MKKRPEIVSGGDFILIDGKLVDFDPFDPADPYNVNLPERCKLFWTELVTGQKCKVVKKKSLSDS